jgi:hypothetical protein
LIDAMGQTHAEKREYLVLGTLEVRHGVAVCPAASRSRR